MCLIISKPAGVDVPLDLILSAMDYNADGVGIMANGGADRWVKIRPHKLQRKINRLGAAAIHFRMATHGRVDQSNVHPFRAIDGSQIMHNGVLYKYAPFSKMAAAESDTSCFVRDFVNPMLKRTGTIDIQEIANETAGNALAVMRPDGVIALTGTSWVDYAGLALSNTYAWDAPAELRKNWSYDIHADTDPLADKRLPVLFDQRGDVDRAAELEDMLMTELQLRTDEIDFMDSDCTRHFDTLDYASMLADEITQECFLERCNAEALLALRIQLARRSS